MYYAIESTIALLISFIINLFVVAVFAKGFYPLDPNTSVDLFNAGALGVRASPSRAFCGRPAWLRPA